MEKNWSGLPFRPISDFYRMRFGEKVYKIPVSIVESCPNREGLKGMETCLFCDEWGSSAKAESLKMDLRTQIEDYGKKINRRFHAQKFLVYFQAYTNSFARLSTLKNAFEIAASYDFVKGFVVGTRPDCLSKSVLDLWNSYTSTHYVGVELGVQSFKDDDLIFLKRGHTVRASLEAIQKIHDQTQVDIGIHLMFGQRGETREDMIKTAQTVNKLPLSNVKLHNLHVLKNTGLEQLFRRGEFQPFDRLTYAQHVGEFLSHLSPRVFVHRLAAYSSRWDELISPDWTCDKMGTHQFLVDYLRANKIFQSQNFYCSLPELCELKQALSQRVEPLKV